MSSDKLEKWRTQIDAYDVRILKALAGRREVTDDVGRWKAEEGKPVQDKQRERAKLDDIRQKARDHDVDPDDAEEVFALIMKQTRRRHRGWRKS